VKPEVALPNVESNSVDWFDKLMLPLVSFYKATSGFAFKGNMVKAAAITVYGSSSIEALQVDVE